MVSVVNPFSITANSIFTAALQALAVTGAKIDAATITEANMAPLSIGTPELQLASVDTSIITPALQHGFAVFTASGTFTPAFSIPHLLILVGGGGGGGGGAGADTANGLGSGVSSGGGAAPLSLGVNALTAGAVYNVTIGTGGAGGAGGGVTLSGISGAGGGDTLFDVLSTAIGGVAGNSALYANSAPLVVGNSYNGGGFGGGVGGLMGGSATNGTLGGNATGYGSGGGGGGSGGGANLGGLGAAGGTGSSGVCIIFW